MIEREEAIGAAIVRLVEAVDRYDETKGAKLRSYVTNQVFYAVVDRLRKVWGRESLEPGGRLAIAYALMKKNLLNSFEFVEEIHGNQTALSHNTLLSDLLRKEITNQTLDYIQRLDGTSRPGRARGVSVYEVFRLRFVEDLTLDQIGARVGVTGGRVHQILSRTAAQIRERFPDVDVNDYFGR